VKYKGKRILFWQYLTGLIVAGICIVLSISIGNQTGIYSDFAVFWNAGNNFLHGNALYSGIGGACRFIYPPFAAWLFQVFALFPLQVAATLFGIVNFILYFLALYLTRKVFGYIIEDKKKLNIALFVSALLSFRYFWYHFHFIQLNITVFVLCLAGIIYFFKGKQTLSAGFFVLATLIKVFPVFFLIWLVLRGSLKTPFIILGFLFFFSIIPLINRGFSQGISDLKDYNTTFIQPFEHGRIEPQYHNHSLSSAIYKATQHSNEGDGYDYRIFDVSMNTTNLIYKISFIVLFGMTFFLVIRNRILKLGITAYELSVIFLAMLLLCGITWEYHLVTLLFVYMSLVTKPAKIKSRVATLIRMLLFLSAVALSIVGKDTVGDRYFHYFGGYNSLTILMLWLFICFFFCDIFLQGIPMQLKKDNE